MIKMAGNNFKNITPLGQSSRPEQGFYEVSITNMERGPNDKFDARRVHVEFETGFKMFSFVSVPFDDNGEIIQSLKSDQVRGRLALLRSILESLGYTAQQIETAEEIDTNWFLTSQNGGRKAYVEFIPGQKGVQGSYNEIGKWLTKEQFNKLTATESNQPNAQVSNGAPVPPTGVSLPPPTSPAQGLA